MAELNIFGQDSEGQVAEGDFLNSTFQDVDNLEKITKTAVQQTTKPPVKPPVKKEGEEEIVDEKKPDPLEAVKGFFTTEEKKDGVVVAEGDDKTKNDTETGGGDDDNQFKTLSEELYNLNIFQPLFDEEGNEIKEVASTPEEFKQLFENQANNKVGEMLDEFLTRFGDDKRKLFDAVFVKGLDPNKYFTTAVQLDKMKGLDLTVEANQERVVREFYKRNGMPEEKIAPKIQRLKDIAELQSEAEGYHPILIQQDDDNLVTQETQAQQKIAQESRNDKLYQQSITKILVDKIKEKDFDGLPVNDKIANDAFSFLYDKTHKDPATGKKLTDFDVWVMNLNRPENHTLKVKVALLAKSNFDLSKVKQKAITTETNKLFAGLEKKSNQKSKITQPDDNSGWSTLLK